MGGEPNQAQWRGIRPTDPAENIPVDVKAFTGNVPIIPASPEKVFTRYEPPEGCTYAFGYNEVSNNSALVYNVAAGTVLYLISFNLLRTINITYSIEYRRELIVI